jgi:L-malate glycosyltransferase
MNKASGLSEKRVLTVLHVCSGDVWAGAERMIATLLRALSLDPGIKPVALVLNEGHLSQILREGNIETVVLPESVSSFATLLRKAYRRFAGQSIDIIHSHGYKENVLSCCLARTIGTNHFYSTIHGLSETAQSAWNFKTLKYKALMQLSYGLLKRECMGICAVSQDIRKVLVQREGFRDTHVEVIHNGIGLTDWENFRPVPRIDERVHIGTVGRMVPVKRFDQFLAIATEVVKRNQNIRFSILGDGPLKEDLAILIKRLALDKSVTLETPQEDPRAYYHSLDVYMNTSDHEGIPLSILEAMASKKPIIAPRVGGIPEIISHGEEGYLLDGGRADEFVRYCLALSADGNRRRTMGEKGNQTVVSRFSSKTMSNAYKTLYEAGIQSSRSGSAYHPHYSARSMP